MNSNRQAVAGKDGYFELSETIKAFVDHTCLWNFYMISFMLMEQSDVKIHMIHSLADDKIPFCPYFIIPYVLWYFFLIGTVIYFAVFCPSKRILSISRNSGCRYDTVSADLLCISERTASETGSWQYRRRCVYQCDTFLYKIDTPTNIFPSMHVFNATASCIALYQNERCRKNKLFTVSQIILQYRSFYQRCS